MAGVTDAEWLEQTEYSGKVGPVTLIRKRSGDVEMRIGDDGRYVWLWNTRTSDSWTHFPEELCKAIALADRRFEVRRLP